MFFYFYSLRFIFTLNSIFICSFIYFIICLLSYLYSCITLLISDPLSYLSSIILFYPFCMPYNFTFSLALSNYNDIFFNIEVFDSLYDNYSFIFISYYLFSLDALFLGTKYSLKS